MNPILERVLDADGVLAYINVFLLLLAGAFGLPIPEDLALLAAGVLVHSVNVNVFLMFSVAYFGVILGDVLLYRAGRMAGPAILRRRWIRSRITSTRLKSIRQNLETKSLFTIFIARHLFYLRSITFILCGAVRMDFTNFLIADAIAALVTVPLFMFLGYLGAQHFDYILSWINNAKYVLVGLGVLAIGLSYRYYVSKSVEETVKDIEEEG